MKHILLLRHAQALPAKNGGDIERALSDKGLSDSFALGRFLKRQDLFPDYILCSSARRTRQTCEHLLAGLGRGVHAEYINAMYTADLEDLFTLIQETDDRSDTLLLIAHNPTIYELAVRLSPKGDEVALERLADGYPPASLSIIQAKAENWASINPPACKLKSLFWVEDYEG